MSRYVVKLSQQIATFLHGQLFNSASTCHAANMRLERARYRGHASDSDSSCYTVSSDEPFYLPRGTSYALLAAHWQ